MSIFSLEEIIYSMIQASKGVSSKYCVNCMEIAPDFFIFINLDIKLINAKFRNN